MCNSGLTVVILDLIKDIYSNINMLGFEFGVFNVTYQFVCMNEVKNDLLI